MNENTNVIAINLPDLQVVPLILLACLTTKVINTFSPALHDWLALR